MSKSALRNIITLALGLVLSAPLFAQFRTGANYDNLYDSETVSALKEHVSYLASAQMEGRKAGSEGEKMAAEYMHEILSSYGVDMISPKSGSEFGIASEQDTLVSRNVYGYIEGYDKSLKDHYIVVGARLDNLGTRTMTVDGQKVESIYFGANGNASGLAMLAELARMVATNSIIFRRSVVFVAFGASCESFAGSWYFADRLFGGKVDAMIDLDMLGTGSQGFYAYTSSNQDMNTLIASMKGTLQPIFPELTAAEPYPSDHRTFYAKEIPSVMFTTGRYSEHNTSKDTASLLEYETMEKELEYIYNFTHTVANNGSEILFFPVQVSERKKGASLGSDIVAYYDCDQKPLFSNSADINKFMNDWVYRLLKYPASAVEQGIQGTVQVNFVIDKNGAVTDVTVVRGVHPLLDDEAVKVISASPKWKPARVRGEKVRSSLTVGVEFRLQKKSERRRFGINGY